MRIALIDPFFDTSHKKWAEGFQKYSRHVVDIYAESPHNWKWKMTGGAIPAARKLNESSQVYNLLLVTDMIQLPLFKSLLHHRFSKIPIALYFHENQITYPWSPGDPDIIKKRDFHYGFINYTSALIADKIFFNSNYHLESFYKTLPVFLKKFPNHGAVKYCTDIYEKSSVLPIGLELPEFKPSSTQFPVFLWNHRWEYDKNPDLFFNSLFQLKDKGILFKVIVTGKSYKKCPPIFEKAKELLKDELIHFGYVQGIEDYNNLLGKANMLLVTSIQDFFGISTVEGISAGLYPVVPDRLAFKEHVPFDHEGVYKKDEEIIPLLLHLIEEKKYLETQRFSQFVRKYSWQNLIELYDDRFEKLM